MAKATPVKVALLSCGLVNVCRGFEISTARWHESLSRQEPLNVRLYCGGQHRGGTKVWNLSRDSLLSGPLSFFPLLNDRRRWELGYGLEQISFAFGLLPDLLSWQPDVIWTKEAPLAHVLDIFRRLLNLRYKIVFANGGAFRPSTYRQFDFIQHLQPDSYERARLQGVSQTKMKVIPNCAPQWPLPTNREALRQSFGYSGQDWVVVCVAAWNKYHKRIDYLIDEVAAMNDDQVKLLLIGHPETETPGLKIEAEQKLPGRINWLTLPPERVIEALYLSDAFVLASFYEGLGTVLIEAALAGVPIVSHPHGGSRFILEDESWLVDLSQPGNLSRRLEELRLHPPDAEIIEALRKRVGARFNQAALAKEFTDMILKVAAKSPSPAGLIEVNPA